MGSQAWDGCLSGPEFRAAALYLVDSWANHCTDFEPWRWQDCSKLALASPDSANGYLVLEDVPVYHEGELSEAVEGTFEGSMNEDRALDSATHVPQTGSKFCFYTYHVIYSESYRVPMLYLRGQFPDGRALSWDDVQQTLPAQARAASEQMRWTFMTQEEHPYIRRPWLALHPCGTGSLMSMIFLQRFGLNSSIKQFFPGDNAELDGLDTDCVSEKIVVRANELYSMPSVSTNNHSLSMKHYLLTWLSFASQAVGLILPAGFYKCFLTFYIHCT